MSAAVLSPSTRSAVAELKRLIRTTRRRLRWSWLAAGVCLVVGLVAATLVIAVAFDLAFVLPDFGRWTVFGVAAGIAAVIFASRVLRPTLTRLPTPGVALRIERRTENMHNRLLTVLDLAGKPIEPEAMTFFDAVVAQTSLGNRSHRLIDRRGDGLAELRGGRAATGAAAVGGHPSAVASQVRCPAR
jgi:4-amino-4-deoxy-L-arabinose transferase-like glycosyltransferase